MMKFNPNFVNKIKNFNGQNIELCILTNSPNEQLGLMGMMTMNPEHVDLVNSAMKHYNGKNRLIEMRADMEFIVNSVGEKLIFLNNDFDCNCIEIFKPDMSLWWSYHALSDRELNQLSLTKHKGKVNNTTTKGDCFPIHDIIVNGISHYSQGY